MIFLFIFLVCKSLRPRIHALSLVTQTPEEINADDDGQWIPGSFKPKTQATIGLKKSVLIFNLKDGFK